MSSELHSDIAVLRILRSAGVLAALSALSMGLSFLREVAIAAKIGAGQDVDAYLIAALYPILLTTVFASTLSSTVVAVYQRVSHTGAVERDEYECAAWTLAVLLVVAITVLLGALLGPLVRLATPGFRQQDRALAIKMATLLLPAGACGALSAFQSAVLNAKKLFAVPALATSLNSLAVLVTVLVLGDKAGVLAIPYGSLIGGASSLVLLSVYCSRKGVKLRLVRRFWTPSVAHTIRSAAPLTIGVIATFGTLFVDRAMASSLGAGSIAALGYADKVIKIPETVVMGTLAVVLFPYLAQSAAAADGRELSEVSTFGVNAMLLLLVPITVVCAVMNRPIIELLLQRGRFDVGATQMTALALSGYALGLAFNGMGYVFPRILLALEKNYVIAVLGFGNILLKLAYNSLLIPILGHAGIALATSLMYLTTDLLFVLALLHYGVRLDVRKVTKSLALGVLLGIAVVGGVLAGRIAHLEPGTQLMIGVACGLGLGVLVYRYAMGHPLLSSDRS